MLSISENLHASDASFYFQGANKIENKGNYYGAISDLNKAAEIVPKDNKVFLIEKLIKLL